MMLVLLQSPAWVTSNLKIAPKATPRVAGDFGRSPYDDGLQCPALRLNCQDLIVVLRVLVLQNVAEAAGHCDGLT